MAKRCTKSTKLVEFHFKFLHRRVPTNDFLTKIGFQDNDNCTFCLDTSGIINPSFLVMSHNIILLERYFPLVEKCSFDIRRLHRINLHCFGSEAVHFQIRASSKLLSPFSQTSYMACQNKSNSPQPYPLLASTKIKVQARNTKWRHKEMGASCETFVSI